MEILTLTNDCCHGVVLELTNGNALWSGLSLYRVQPVAAGCIIGWDAALPLMQCPPYSTLVLILPTSEG